MSTNWSIETKTKTSTTDNFTVETKTQTSTTDNFTVETSTQPSLTNVWESYDTNWESLTMTNIYTGNQQSWEFSDKATSRDSD